MSKVKNVLRKHLRLQQKSVTDKDKEDLCCVIQALDVAICSTWFGKAAMSEGNDLKIYKTIRQQWWILSSWKRIELVKKNFWRYLEVKHSSSPRINYYSNGIWSLVVWSKLLSGKELY